MQLLLQNPLLLLMVVAGFGYVIGRVRFRGFGLGIAAVLFVGLAIGAIDRGLKLPDFVYQLGLIIFVYTIGISSGPGFFNALRARGLRNNLLVLACVIAAGALTYGAARMLGLERSFAAGLFCGGLTSTPALAAVLDSLQASSTVSEQALAEPVVAYSVAYPMGVLGVLLAIQVLQRAWKISYAAEAQSLRRIGAAPPELVVITARVRSNEVVGSALGDLTSSHAWHVVFGRVRRAEELHVASLETRLELDDLVTIIGDRPEVDRVIGRLGEVSNVQIQLDRSVLDFRRIIASNRAVVGKTLDELALPRRFGAVATRLRRGDVDLVTHGSMIIEPGDRVRIVAPPERMHEIAEYFGDSISAVSEIDIAAFSLGITLGLLVGMIPIPMPGGIVFHLGFAGGPLIVGLVLGAVGRTGPVNWHLPFNANLTLRQFGLVLFLAGVGTRSGFAFVSTLQKGGGFQLFLLGTAITLLAAISALWVGHRLLHVPMSVLTGVVAGLHTQPAVLAFASEQTHNELPDTGYAAVYPTATLAKILVAQALLAILS